MVLPLQEKITRGAGATDDLRAGRRRASRRAVTHGTGRAYCCRVGATSGEVTNVMVRRALELYPMHTPAQIHRLNALGTNEIKVLMKLEALRLEFSRSEKP
jgi:hypothetical protein